MKQVFFFFLVLTLILPVVKAQTVVVNSDGTHSTVIHHGATATNVNSDGTHSTVIDHGTTKTIVNAEGTHSTVIGPGKTKTLIKPNGTHSIIIGTGVGWTVVNFTGLRHATVIDNGVTRKRFPVFIKDSTGVQGGRRKHIGRRYLD